MMNSKALLSKKRNRNKNNSGSNSIKNMNSHSPVFQINGFNIVELHHIESTENKNISNNREVPKKNIIELKESNSNLHELNQNNSEIKEMTKAKIKNIEEFYTSKFGISTIKENCFKCLMTDFLSNELLYFNTRNELFNYCKYCFVSKRKNLFMDEIICKENKEDFFKANISFLNSWRFFIPKTICKGCFMEIINQKNLISNIKNIFSDIEKDSLCRTNYRNYALFSPRFRAAFSLRNRSKSSRRRSRSYISRNNKAAFNHNESEVSLNINISNKQSSRKKEDTKIEIENEKIYNSGVKLEKKNIISVDKSMLGNSVIEELKQIKSNKKNENKKISDGKIIMNENNLNIDKNKHYININLNINNNFDKKEIINNINFNGQNNINIIKKINNINNNPINNNLNLISIKLSELIKDMNAKFQSFFMSLEYVKRKMALIIEHMYIFIQKYEYFIKCPTLINNTSIYKDSQILKVSLEEDIKSYKINYLNAKDSSEKLINFLITVERFIINQKEQENLLFLIKCLKQKVSENKDELGKHEEGINIFKSNLNLLIRFVFEIIKS